MAQNRHFYVIHPFVGIKPPLVSGSLALTLFVVGELHLLKQFKSGNTNNAGMFIKACKHDTTAGGSPLAYPKGAPSVRG